MKPNKPSKCDVCATPYFERNNYFYGKQFTVRDLIQEQSYFNEKRHLVNRMVLGWGVVCGLDVHWEPKKREFIVGTGMALDCCGREIIICEPQPVPFEDYDTHCRVAREKPDYGSKFVLCLEYDDCHSEPVTLPPAGCEDQERTEYNRVRDGFKLRIRKWEEDCPKQPDKVPCPQPFNNKAPESEKCKTETLHHYLCQRLKDGCHECEGCACVVLGTIYIKPGNPGQYEPPKDYQQKPLGGYQQEPGGYQQQPPSEYQQEPPASAGYQQQPPSEYQQEPTSGGYQQQPPSGSQQPPPPRGGYQQQPNPYEQRSYEPQQGVHVWIDTCTDRRLVYNNSLLYDLIYCHHGDLPHIVDFNWRKPAGPNRELDWDTFAQLVTDGLRVYFDQEMEWESLNSHTFFLTFFHEDRDSGNLFVKRIPDKHIKPDYYEGCHTALWLPDEKWLKDEIENERSHLADGCEVEITLRGSRIWDKRRKGLDGAYLADKLPTGNGTQGTEFVDWFRVLKRGAEKYNKPETYSDF